MGECACVEFAFVPVYGTSDLRCVNCKESFKKHSTQHPHAGPDKTCTQFESKYNCICKYGYEKHTTVFETRDQRIKSGKVVGVNDTGFNLNKFSNEMETN